MFNTRILTVDTIYVTIACANLSYYAFFFFKQLYICGPLQSWEVNCISEVWTSFLNSTFVYRLPSQYFHLHVLSGISPLWVQN